MPHEAKALAQLFRKHSRILVFTGAGISTESGLSDYRSKGGIWERFQPVTIQEFLADEDKFLKRINNSIKEYSRKI